MTISLPNLDDRRFKDLVDEMRALIPRYAPNWTNHNISDPGITLIEMFAFLTEAIIYRLNRIPNAAEVRFLELLGAEFKPAHPAKIAVSISTKNWDVFEDGADFKIKIPGGTLLWATFDGDGSSVLLETLEQQELSKDNVKKTVSAHQLARTSGEVVGKSNGQPFQWFTLEKSMVVVIPEAPYFEMPTVMVNDEVWFYRRDLVDSTPDDHHFTVEPLFNRIRFGSASIPPEGAVITASYAYTEGVKGNLRSGTALTRGAEGPALSDDTQAVLDAGVTLTFSVESIENDGTDAIGIEAARADVHKELKRRWRAVTAEDFETLALSDEINQKISMLAKDEKQRVDQYNSSDNGSSGGDGATVSDADADPFLKLEKDGWSFLLSEEKKRVLRAKCLAESDLTANGSVGDAPGHVSVIVVPSKIDVPSTDAEPASERELNEYEVAALTELAWQALDERRLITCRHHIVGTTYTTFYIDAEIALLPRVPAVDVKTQILTNLKAFFHETTGGPSNDGLGWPFGRDVYVSEVCEVIEKTSGVDHVETITLLGPTSEDNGFEPASQVAVPPNSLVRFDFEESTVRIKL